MEKGKDILKSMEDQNADDFAFKKIKHEVTLSSKTNIEIDGEEVVVDPKIHFNVLLLRQTTFPKFFFGNFNVRPFEYPICTI